MGAIGQIVRNPVDAPRRPGRQPLGQILLRHRWIGEDDLEAALSCQARSGERLGQVISARGWSRPERVGAALAEQWGLGFVDLDQEPADPGLLGPAADMEVCLSRRILPWRRLGYVTTYVTDQPEEASVALAHLTDAAPMAFFVVATPQQMDAALSAAFGPALAQRAAKGLPAQRSVRSLGRARGIAGLAAGALLAAFLSGGEVALTAAVVLVLAVHLATLALRAAALVAGARRVGPTLARPPAGAALLADRKPPPVVSLLVPLYREGGMIPAIVEALSRLDYPRELLDVKLLVEETDAETRDAIARQPLPGWIAPLVVPEGQPRTKPRALNHALAFCRGDIVGVLDAEDRPDPQQLNLVVAHLASAPRETMAVQCQLSYYNASDNWMARCFQLEYAIWFEVLLRGYRRLGLPLPLGGTSVYFRADALRALDGWDAHNVTEDADLGVRLARAGGHCAVLRSTTDEEATCRPLAWIRQRSRWTKGYLLTWLCHMRNPAALWRDLGPRGFGAFQAIFLGGPLTYLAMPLFWLSLASWAWSGDVLWHRAIPDAAVAPVGATLLAGWGVMLSAAAIAAVRRRTPALLAWAPVLPIYWWLGAVAAWKALAEMIIAPYWWDKTEHGLSPLSGTAPGDDASEPAAKRDGVRMRF